MIYGNLFGSVTIVVGSTLTLCCKTRSGRFGDGGGFVTVQLRRPRNFIRQLLKFIVVKLQFVEQFIQQ